MKLNKWTVGLAAAGVVSLGSVVHAEEAPHQVLTALSSTTLSGYVDTSAIWKFGTGDDLLPGRAFDGVGKLDGFNLDVAEVTISKPLDESDWAAGYKVNLLFGPDANGYNTSPFGGGPATSDFSVKDAYVSLRAPVGNGINFKVGTFSTVLGYEVFEAGDNPNFSRSFGWQLEPTQHTGVLASYRLNNMIGLAVGVADTWNAGINNRSSAPFGPRAESDKTYMGAITVTAPDSAGAFSGTTLYLAGINGFDTTTVLGKRTSSLYAGLTMPTPLKQLTVGAAFDYRFDGSVSVVNPGQTTSYAWAAAAYASYQATSKFKLNGRVDYTTGSDGTFYDAGVPGVSDHRNELIAYTLTADYSLWANVISRAELRWDHSLTGQRIYGLASNPDRNAVTLAANIIYKF